MKYRQAPQIIHMNKAWFEQLRTLQTSKDGKHWYPARACGLDTWPNRIRAAWLVFTGQADALLWPSPETVCGGE